MSTPRPLHDIRRIVDRCAFENFTFLVEQSGPVLFLRAVWLERCIVSGRQEEQSSRKWLLSRHMTRSELVQTCFKLALTAVEHRARETFTYRGKRIFGPHFDVEALHKVCTDQRFDVRDKVTE